MLNLTSYLDETGHADDPNIEYVGMAGFVAPAGVWEIFEEKWLNVLKNAGFSEPFHMKDFAHSTGQFVRWAGKEHERERQLFMGRLIEIILETRATPIGAIVSMSAFRSLTAAQQAMFVDPYYIAFRFCTKGCAVDAIYKELDEKVAMVYAYQDEFGVNGGGRAEGLWHYMKKEGKPYGHRMGSYASSSPEDLCPLQAADLFAYELGKEFVNQIRRPNDRMRWPMRQIIKLLTLPVPDIILFDRIELLREIKAMDWFHDHTGTEEVSEEILRADRMMEWIYRRGELPFGAKDAELLKLYKSMDAPPDMTYIELVQYVKKHREEVKNEKTNPETVVPECIEGPEAFRRFDEGIRKILSVPHSTLARRERAYRKKSLQNPNRRGPKPKATESSDRASRAED